MVKSDVDLRIDSKEDIQSLLNNYFNLTISSVSILRGGYSGTNYQIICSNGFIAVIKVCNGYSMDEVEEQAIGMSYLRDRGYTKACYSYSKLLIDKYKYVSTTIDNQPVICLSYLIGKASDYLIEQQILSPNQIIVTVASNLAEMHVSTILTNESINSNVNIFRNYLNSGACNVGKHVKREYIHLFTNTTDNYISSHDYVKYYLNKVVRLIDSVSNSDLPVGLLHGDPFLDNTLIDEHTGEFSGFVDFEDVTIGPFLFDIGCFIAGNCFDESNKISIDLVKSFQIGYQDKRPLTALEKSLFIQFIANALICNSCWRFINFNITYPDKRQELGDRYYQLQQVRHY